MIEEHFTTIYTIPINTMQNDIGRTKTCTNKLMGSRNNLIKLDVPSSTYQNKTRGNGKNMWHQNHGNYTTN